MTVRQVRPFPLLGAAVAAAALTAVLVLASDARSLEPALAGRPFLGTARRLGAMGLAYGAFAAVLNLAVGVRGRAPLVRAGGIGAIAGLCGALASVTADTIDIVRNDVTYLVGVAVIGGAISAVLTLSTGGAGRRDVVVGAAIGIASFGAVHIILLALFRLSDQVQRLEPSVAAAVGTVAAALVHTPPMVGLAQVIRRREPNAAAATRPITPRSVPTGAPQVVDTPRVSIDADMSTAPSDGPAPHECEMAAPAEPQIPTAARTPLLVLGDGRRIQMTAPVILGRRPPAVELVDGRPAIPVGLDDPTESIDKAHATIRIESGRVVVADRATRVGTVLDFADGRTITLEGASAIIEQGTTVRIGPHTIRLDS